MVPSGPPTCCHRAMCTAQSRRPGSEYSRVPSTGSTIHTRSALSRARSSGASSEHRVIGTFGTQPGQDVGVGAGVTGIAEIPREIVADLLADRQQQPAGVDRQIGGQIDIAAIVGAEVTLPVSWAAGITDERRARWAGFQQSPAPPRY